MTKSKFWLWSFIAIIVGMVLQWYLCCSPQTVAAETAAPEVVVTPPPVEPKTTSYPFAFQDVEKDFSYDKNENIDFNVSNFEILNPVGIDVKAGILKLATFLKENPNKAVNITGYYTDQEQYNGSFPNLGLARANAVKNYFVDRDISSKQINTAGELRNEMVADGAIYRGPLAYEITTAANDTSAKDALKALGDKIRANPITLHFETGQTSINLTPEQRQKIADISKYLDKVAGAKAIVEGHTDSKGKRKSNIKLGKGRADFAKGYLIKNGIPKDKIISTSKGPDEPVASNKTEEGRAENRRTVITVNKSND